MEAEPRAYEDIVARILADYNKHPKGWHVLLTKSQGMGYDAYILRPEGMMAMIKLESIYKPKPVGVGVEITEEMRGLREIVEGRTHSFGVRPIPEGLLVKLLNSIGSGAPPPAGLITKIMENEPVSQEEITASFALQGPILHVSKPLPLEYASTRQRELDLRLQRQLQRLLYEKYGHPYTG